jgi:hypothetical protein
MYSVSTVMGISKGLPLILFVLIGMTSYFFYHKKLKEA